LTIKKTWAVAAVTRRGAKPDAVGVTDTDVGNSLRRLGRLGRNLSLKNRLELAGNHVRLHTDLISKNAIELNHQIGIAFPNVAVDFADAVPFAFTFDDFGNILSQLSQLLLIWAEQFDFNRLARAG